MHCDTVNDLREKFFEMFDLLVALGDLNFWLQQATVEVLNFSFSRIINVSPCSKGSF